MIVQTLETPNVLSGQTFLYNSSCWTYVGFFTIPYHEPVGYIRTDYSGNYFGVPGASYNSCGDCQSAPIITPSITPTPTPTPSIDIRLFNVESCCSGNQGVFQIIGNEILPEPPYTVNAYFWSGEDYTDRNLNTFECYEVLEEVTSGTVVETIPSSLFLDAIGYSGTTCQTGATQYNYTTIETISGATLIGADIYEATVCSVTGMLYLPSYGIPGEDGQDIISESACGSISTGYCTSYTVTGATGSIVGWIDCDGEESFCGCDIEINLDFGVEYQSGSTRATFTVTSSKEVPNDLTVTFTNTIYDDVTSRDVSYEDVSVVISRGNTVGTTTVSDPTDYSDIYPYQTSYENVRTEGSGITINTINKYSSVVFDGKTPPLTRAYIFQDCCGYGNVKNLLVDTSAPWIINGYGVIIEGECYIPRAAGGSGADGEYYGPDFKDCTSRDCPPCVSPTPSVTPSVSITPSVSVTPTSTITPTVTPTNPYYLVCDVVTREYYLTCDVDTDEYLLSCDSEILLPTPSVTPTITTTPSVTSTPSVTNTPSVTPSTSVNVYQTFNVTNNGASSYNIDGSLNPTLTLYKNKLYNFSINASGHPFYIKTATGTGTGNQYNDGVTNNGEVNGTITFLVPNSAPSTLYYQCSIHSSMNGIINITDEPVNTTPTPSISVTPSVTPSLTTGDKTIYVYYPNI